MEVTRNRKYLPLCHETEVFSRRLREDSASLAISVGSLSAVARAKAVSMAPPVSSQFTGRSPRIRVGAQVAGTVATELGGARLEEASTSWEMVLCSSASSSAPKAAWWLRFFWRATGVWKESCCCCCCSVGVVGGNDGEAWAGELLGWDADLLLPRFISIRLSEILSLRRDMLSGEADGVDWCGGVENPGGGDGGAKLDAQLSRSNRGIGAPRGRSASVVRLCSEIG